MDTRSSKESEGARDQNRPEMRRAAFLITIDFELAWGMSFDGSHQSRERTLLNGRDAIHRLLDLLDQYTIPATWATVGHLFLEGCKQVDGVAHPEVVHPTYETSGLDPYSFDPCSDVRSFPLWYAPDLIENITSRRVGHELASHSFGHLLLGDPACSSETALSDFQAGQEIGHQHGLAFRSFVFPQHMAAYLDMLTDFGFSSYRTETRDVAWRYPYIIRRAGRIISNALGIAPRVLHPEIGSKELVNLPASLRFALPESRQRWVITPARLVRRCKRGIEKAMRSDGMFQMYFHDFNLGVRSSEFFAALEEVLEFVDRNVKVGNLNVLTMNQYAEEARRRKREVSP